MDGTDIICERKDEVEIGTGDISSRPDAGTEFDCTRKDEDDKRIGVD